MQISSSLEGIGVPVVGAGELHQFFKRFCQIVVTLEHAYQNHRLSECLADDTVERCIGMALCNHYERLLKCPVIPDPHRRRIATVCGLLDQAGELLFRVDARFHAEIEIDEANSVNLADCTTPVHDRYRVTQCSDQPISLRVDQVFAARNWGIEFYLDDESETNRLVQLQASQTLLGFVRDMNQLAKMLPRQLLSDPAQFPPIVPPRSGRVLELLIIDILNEHSRHARSAPLVEDYSGKTDLRVRYPELKRKQGARVQVTWASSLFSHRQKIYSLARLDQYVVLSPWSLARAVKELGCGREDSGDRFEFGAALLETCWACIESHPGDMRALASAIRKILDRAINSPIRDPRGPMAMVPEPVRKLIREWVHHEAIRSTNALRQWLADGGNFQRSFDGRLSVRTYPTG